jgi:hypothetical protein
MTFQRTSRFTLAALLGISSLALTANAQQPAKPLENVQSAVSLSNAQVFKIQALVQSQATELRSLSNDVESRQEDLKAAIAANDPIRIEMAVLALDASEKALSNTQQANERDLMSLLNTHQKELFKEYLTKSASNSGL